MILVRRGDEPPGLGDARREGLSRARAAFNAHGPGSEELRESLTGYDLAKKPLFKAQHRKCAYCERRVGLGGQPTEHYRPKAEAWRHMRGDPSSDIDRARYWWLTWEWRNLLFACVTCNSKAAKGNYFPLVPGSSPLRAPKRKGRGALPRRVHGESPLLLDPGDETIDHYRHLRWIPVDDSMAPRLWTWNLHALTAKGRATRLILDLERLGDDVNDRYKTHVEPEFDRVRSLLIEAKSRRAELAWRRLFRHAAADQPFAAATWWQLDALRAWVQPSLGCELPAAPRP